MKTIKKLNAEKKLVIYLADLVGILLATTMQQNMTDILSPILTDNFVHIS